MRKYLHFRSSFHLSTATQTGSVQNPFPDFSLLDTPCHSRFVSVIYFFPPVVPRAVACMFGREIPEWLELKDENAFLLSRGLSDWLSVPSEGKESEENNNLWLLLLPSFLLSLGDDNSPAKFISLFHLEVNSVLSCCTLQDETGLDPFQKWSLTAVVKDVLFSWGIIFLLSSSLFVTVEPLSLASLDPVHFV